MIDRVRADVPFELDVIDIGGDPELERRYRTAIPVVEIDGEAAFTYFVSTEAFRELVSGGTRRSGSESF
jgi:hypothetical protein